jgi:hypothetical protein
VSAFAAPEGEGLLSRPTHCVPNATRHENLCVRRLTARVNSLEKTLAAVCSAVIFADDLAFNERAAHAMGDVYMDAHLQTSRRPRWLRRSMQDVVTEHNLPLLPPQNHWHHRDLFHELERRRAAGEDTSL